MKIAIVLFNLGGPDSLEAVQPFLRNLFSDPAIITLPSWLRLPLASFIASRRTAKATAIYARIGGSSPILGQTEAQARALVHQRGDGTPVGARHQQMHRVAADVYHTESSLPLPHSTSTSFLDLIMLSYHIAPRAASRGAFLHL